MSNVVLIDYGCHGFTHRLATHLSDLGYPLRYFANGSLESPNLKSLPAWSHAHPNVVRIVKCPKPYGKMGLHRRLQGELEWAKHCIAALQQDPPAAIIVSTVPLAAVTRIQKWAVSRNIPFVYWLQDLQGRAMHDLLGHKLGMAGRVLGSFAYLWEQQILENSRMVITIAPGHEQELPLSVRQTRSHALLENWADLEQFPQFPVSNEWSIAHGLDQTSNVIYSGTLGLKHDLSTFLALANALRNRPEVRIVVVSTGQAADLLRTQASQADLSNLLVLPFQPYKDVPKVLASATVLIAPLEASAGGFCVPSKVLSYYCAGRPTVIAIDSQNPAAKTIRQIGAGAVIAPGDSSSFVKAVNEYLDNPGLRQLAGQRARTYAEQTFGLEQVTQKFLAIMSRSNINLRSTRTDIDLTKSAVAS